MARRPNILMFMTDQQKAQVIDPDHPCQTPNAQRLADAGVRFTRAYTPAAHCCPSRASFMTGLYPSRHGVYNNVLNGQAIHTGLAGGVATFGEQLRAAGYRMVYAGKWRVSAHERPRDRGWEELDVSSHGGQRHGLGWDDWRRQLAQETAPSSPRRDGEILRPGWGRYRLYGTGPEAAKTGDYRTVRQALGALRS